MGLRGPRAVGHGDDYPTGPPRKGRKRPTPVATPLVVTKAMVAAFLTLNETFFREMPEFEGAWMDTPLTTRQGTCTQRHPIAATMPGFGCRDQHLAFQLRARIIAEIERRGQFRWADRLDADDATAWEVWVRLSGVAEDVGVTGPEWRRMLDLAWERTEPEGSQPGARTEETPSDG